MTAAGRFGSFVVALTLLAPAAALANPHHDRDGDWDDRGAAYADRGWAGQFRDVAFNNGYQDGLQKGREDGWNRNGFDPYHHLWYRGASRGYNGGCSHEEYRDIYREGFRSGYAAGFGSRPVVGYAAPPVYNAPVYSQAPVYTAPVYTQGPVYTAPVYVPAPVNRSRVGIHVDIWRR